MKHFPSEFSVFADTDLSSFMRGAGRLSIRELLHTHGQMQSSSKDSPSSTWTPSSTPNRAYSVTSSSAFLATTGGTKGKEKEGSTAFKILRPLLEEKIPQCFSHQRSNIELENFLLYDDETERTNEDAVEFLGALAAMKFSDYSSQAIRGVTDTKGGSLRLT